MSNRYLTIFIFVALAVGFGCSPRSYHSNMPQDLPAFTNSLGIKMIEIPEGQFQMGHPRHRPPVRKVQVSSFFISETEVTNLQYEMLVADFKRSPLSPGDHDPATGISRTDAQAYAKLLSEKEDLPYRLPTDAEWEYAARGGLEQKDFPWGNQRSLSSNCNTGLNGYPLKAVAVKSYPPNAFGLYDMVGNAEEWVLDSFDELQEPFLGGILVDPLYQQPDGLWVMRGGSFNSWYPYVWSAFPSAPTDDPNDTFLFYEVGIRLVISELHQH